jgi:hypothetical protein
VRMSEDSRELTEWGKTSHRVDRFKSLNLSWSDLVESDRSNTVVQEEWRHEGHSGGG